MTMGTSHRRTTTKTVFNSTTTSIGRFYEKRHRLTGALDQYTKVLSANPTNTAIYIDRSRVHMKMGSIARAQQDTGNE
jgi:hypothetical protein